MEMKYNVRLKSRIKAKIIAGSVFLALPIALFGLYLYQFSIPKTVYKDYFIAKVIEPTSGVRPKTGKPLSGGRWINSSKTIIVSSQGNAYAVGTYRLTKIGEQICVGVLGKQNEQEVLGYINVEFENCS
ncbi:hypothetical protein [Glaciecola sp. KUL10]|uniref:hypothetical protein n=1 Tax=Glaciecola sp. (strain KUL10) TaxID=2161813 RepID=UPI000D78B3DE|nr:hypothetical protein [Glaciecola sp. KUL10]GBL06344.1 hypothetical protein KUL10_36910 [Glaciecola sp. KUL10]